MYDFTNLTTADLRDLWHQARAEVWRREGRKLDRAGYPIRRDRREDRDEQLVEATSDSLHPEGF